MAAKLADAVIKPERIQTLVEEIVLQISANSLQAKTLSEAESLPEECRRNLARALFRYNLDIVLIYNTDTNRSLGPASERPYGA